MKSRVLFTATFGVVAVGMFASAADAQRQGRHRGMGQGDCVFDQGEPLPLSEQEEQDVLLMREEEKLARDVYRAMFDLWEVPTFFRISESEQRHMDALGRLIARYDLEDPVVDDTQGVFTNPVFVELYGQLVEAGSASIVEALKVGALIEELDIKDLREALAQTDHGDLQRVYGNLMRGSRNHLRAFAGLITAAGETYEAQHLTQEEFDEIAASPFERGNGRRKGHCWGKRGARGDSDMPGRQQGQRARRGR